MRTFMGIQAMRAVAALAVLIGHAIAFGATGLDPSVALTISGVGTSGVDLFFVISGFIIALKAKEAGFSSGRSGALRFATSRAARIFPLYWIVLAAAFVSSYWISVSSWDLPDTFLWKYLWLGQPGNYYVNTAWTLYFEVNFYAAVAVIILIFPKRAIETLVGAVIALAIAHLLPLPRAPGIFGEPLTLEFGLGAIVAFVAVERGFVRYWQPCLIAAVVLFAAGASMHFWEEEARTARVATVGVGSALMIYAVVAAETRGATFPRIMVDLGNASYSLYVWHFLILKWLATYALAWMPGSIQTVLWIMIVIGAAAASYEIIERSIAKWTHRRPAKLRLVAIEP